MTRVAVTVTAVVSGFLVLCVVWPTAAKAVLFAAVLRVALAGLWMLAKHWAAHPPMTVHLRDDACRLLNERNEG